MIKESPLVGWLNHETRFCQPICFTLKTEEHDILSTTILLVRPTFVKNRCGYLWCGCELHGVTFVGQRGIISITCFLAVTCPFHYFSSFQTLALVELVDDFFGFFGCGPTQNWDPDEKQLWKLGIFPSFPGMMCWLSSNNHQMCRSFANLLMKSHEFRIPMITYWLWIQYFNPKFESMTFSYHTPLIKAILRWLWIPWASR